MMPMHLRYGSWYLHQCEHQCVDIDMYRHTLMLWYPWWSKARPRKHGLGVSKFAAHFWAKQIYMALSCCHMSETVALCSHSPDVAEAFFGEWLEGPRTNARSVITVTLARQCGGQCAQTCKKCRGSFACAFSLNVGCWRAWLMLNTWSKVGVKKRSSGCHDCHILGEVPVETTGWKESDSNSNETKQRRRHRNDTNLIFWTLRILILKPVPFWSRWDLHKQTAKANGLCGNNGLGNAGYLSESLKVRQIKCTSSVSRRLLFLQNGRPQPRLQCVHLRPEVCMAWIQEPSGRAHPWALDPTKDLLTTTKRARSHGLLTPTDLTGQTCRKWTL